MELRSLTLERYKGYAERVTLDLAPLTILVGPNDSGKSALAQAIQLLAGGLAPADDEAREPLPLASGGIRHGKTFEDLVTGRSAHGWIGVGSVFAPAAGREISLDATVQNVVAPGQPAERQISKWRLSSAEGEVAVERLSLAEGAEYGVSLSRMPLSGETSDIQPIVWRGLLPAEPNAVAASLAEPVELLWKWARGVRHLRCPRTLVPSPFRTEQAPAYFGFHGSGGVGFNQGPFNTVHRSAPALGPYGRDAPLALASDDHLLDSVRGWYRSAFGVSLDLRVHGPHRDLVVRQSNGAADVLLEQSGAGLSQVLPVAVAVLTAPNAGPGVEIIEHPEAELHPAAHAHVAELLLANLPGPARPVIVETHSEMLLLRARRWIAERRLTPDQVLVYWVSREPDRGSTLQKIRITEHGDMDSWPQDVFIEDYEEILAIRRAARAKA